MSVSLKSFVNSVLYWWGSPGGSAYVPRLKFKIQLFGILRSRPCPCRYVTHIYAVWHHFILVLCPAVSKPCHSSEFYPNRASLYRVAHTPAQKPYRIGPLFTHKNDNFGAISVTEAAPWKSRKCSITYWIGSVPHFGVALLIGILMVTPEVNKWDRRLQSTGTEVNIQEWELAFGGPNPLCQPLRYNLMFDVCERLVPVPSRDCPYYAGLLFVSTR